jgi:CheY-like chemotaxis protein
MAGALRVMLIDDEPDFLATLAFRLRAKRYDVTVTSGGAEALAHAAAHGWPDVIFLDLVMPRMDGLETLRRIRAANADVPVILLTTTPHEPAELAALRQLKIVGIFEKEGSVVDLDGLLAQALKPRGPAR